MELREAYIGNEEKIDSDSKGNSMMYKIVYDNKPSRLESRVNQLLGQGWTLYGNLVSSGPEHFCQPLIRKK